MDQIRWIKPGLINRLSKITGCHDFQHFVLWEEMNALQSTVYIIKVTRNYKNKSSENKKHWRAGFLRDSAGKIISVKSDTTNLFKHTNSQSF